MILLTNDEALRGYGSLSRSFELDAGDPSRTHHSTTRVRTECQPYTTAVLCPTSIIYPSGSRM